MIKAIITDLDNTLIDTSSLEEIRENRKWASVKDNLDACRVFSDVLDLIHSAKSIGIKIAVFTNSPSHYATKLLSHFEIPYDYLVAYHDVNHHKPAPDGVLKILKELNVSSDQAIYLGDNDLDKQSAFNADVSFFGVDWGVFKPSEIELASVDDLRKLIGEQKKYSGDYEVFSHLIRKEEYLHLGYYLSTIKKEVWDFKDGNQEAITRWIGKTKSVIAEFPKIDVVVRALGHKELSATEQDDSVPLSILSKSLASFLDAKYQPSLIRKNKELEKSTGLNARQRQAQVEGAYYVNSSDSRNQINEESAFLIVDDVLTTGATTLDIKRAILDAFPSATVFVYSLVKTIHRSKGERESPEERHNNQLFSDLYRVVTETEYDAVESAGLINKSFTANYSISNNNFHIQNLSNASIASRAGSEKLLDAIKVAKNIIQRGKPTVASRYLRNKYGINLEDTGFDDGVALPLISKLPVKWSRLIRGDDRNEHNPAAYFFDELLERNLGDYKFLKQLTVPEVKIFDITQAYVDQFLNKQVDFYVCQIGLIIEIDGTQHRDSADEDLRRDFFLAKHGLKVIRFTVNELYAEDESFHAKFAVIRDHCRTIEKLENDGLITPPGGLTLSGYKRAFCGEINTDDCRYKLTSAVRLQLLILELIESAQIRIDIPATLYLLNRDALDFSRYAVSDLIELLNNIFILMGIQSDRLDIKVEEVKSFSQIKKHNSVNVDFSIFQRFDDSFQNFPDIIFVRTHYIDFYRRYSKDDALNLSALILEEYDFFEISTSNPIAYKISSDQSSPQRESLRYFLINLFLPFSEDPDFREGQLGIIVSALGRNGTIGLLPTGSGKSICYQLAAILQPSISFVVCPIKSLMYDQKNDLDAIGFTRTNFITSDLNADEKKLVQRDYGRGRYFFVFVSPERFQTSGFRQEMSAINLDHSFAYAVIDEVHCLSEWGHDFRTSYLNLANTINRFSPDASYIGLTATASVNVLKDIQTEFDIPNEYVRTPLVFTREELSFHVIDDHGRKQDELLGLVRNLEDKWGKTSDLENSRAGIIFTLFVNGESGCQSVAGRLASALKMDVRYYSGSAPKRGGLTSQAFDQYKREVQDDFKKDKYHLLAATKAFGMGVNKGNIAYTIHYGIPGSMEALYQEAGRAGRDKRLFLDMPADCYVLLSKEDNEENLQKIWSDEIDPKDLKERSNKLKRNSDVKNNMFLMNNGVESLKDEYVLLEKIRTFLVDTEEKRIVITAYQFGTDNSKLEKAIYRLSQLGLVVDWTVDFLSGALTVEVANIAEEDMVNNLVALILKYDSDFDLNELRNSNKTAYQWIYKKFDDKTYGEAQFSILILLRWSYDHFVYNRRQSLKTVYEQCIDLSANEIDEVEFKNRLEGYFKFNESSGLIHRHVENTNNVSDWLSVFYNEDQSSLISDADVVTVKEQVSRFLESYKDNIFLDYLSGVCRFISNQFDDSDGERRMSSSLDRLIKRDPAEVSLIVSETIKLKALFSEEAKIRYSMLIDEKFGSNHQELLEIVNAEFEDPYSYRALINPLVRKIDESNKIFKGIEW